MNRVDDISAHFVAEKRAIKASWSAIARMTGVPEVGLRKRFDPTFGGADWMGGARPVAKVSPRETIRRGLVAAGFGDDQALMLSRLWLARGARTTLSDLVAGLGSVSTHAGADLRRAATARGIPFSDVRGGYALTPAGIARIEALVGYDPGRPTVSIDGAAA